MKTVPAKIKTAADLAGYRTRLKQSGLGSEQRCLVICGDTGCSARGSEKIKDAFRDCLEEKRLSATVPLRVTGCLGLCECGPVVIVYPGEIFYQKVKAEDVEEIVNRTVLRGEAVERLLYREPGSGRALSRVSGIPFYRKQKRLLLGDNWKIDPAKIEDYLALGGYEALEKALTAMSGPEIIEEIKRSGLRGRGGAGFLTGVKWAECFEAEAGQKYVICNADEGDPGAFMDRSLLEGNPHLVLEGLIIAGYATGASAGIVFVRAEYPTAVEKVELAIGQLERLGLLGEDILGTGFNFKITVCTGAGAFVCGETSALIRAVEGRAGEPRQKPPHLAERGLHGKPTVINNVETLANVPHIIRRGAAAYARTGTVKSKGTKIFSLVGKVNNTGLVEVPLGMTLREIIFGIGGGLKGGKKFKAVQTGGPSGGCLPEALLDLPADYEALKEAGSMIGSGGMIVMDEDTCMVDLARYFLTFLRDESCGSCFSCREGIARMLDMLEDITRGESSLEQLALLEELAGLVKETSLCGLGQTASNPVLSTLRYFKDEYRVHIVEKRCPAGVCRALSGYRIDAGLCDGCGACVKSCPAGAITGERKKPHRILAGLCTRCGICAETCRRRAVLAER